MSHFLQDFRPLVWFLGLLGFVPERNLEIERIILRDTTTSCERHRKRADEAEERLRMVENVDATMLVRSFAIDLIKNLTDPTTGNAIQDHYGAIHVVREALRAWERQFDRRAPPPAPAPTAIGWHDRRGPGGGGPR